MSKITVKLDDLKKMSETERHKLIQNLREQLRDVRFGLKSEQSQDVRKVRQIKKSIARVLTIKNMPKEIKK